MLQVEIPESVLAREDMRDGEKWRYVLFRLKCKESGGRYTGIGKDYKRDFNIGEMAVDWVLDEYVQKGLIEVRCIGEYNIKAGIDTRLWTMRVVEE
jgi:hypothetical protein